jgi:Tfp pilus assembly protein PilF
MSLINDALKEAQRERSIRGSVPESGPLTEGPRDHFGSHQSSRAPLTLIRGIVVALVVVLALALIPRGILTRSSNTKQALAQTTPALVDSVPTMPEPVVLLQASEPPVAANEGAPSPVVARTVEVSPPPPKTPSIVQPQSSNARREITKPEPGEPDSISVSSNTTAAQDLPRESFVRPAQTKTAVADSLFRLAYAEHMKNNLDSARALYQQSIATQHATAEAYNDYGVLLLARGDTTAAIGMFRQALNHDDKNVEAWVNLGDAFGGMGNHAGAMPAYARANQLDPARPAVKTRISREYEANGDTTMARRYLEDAIKASPNDAAAHHAMGSFLERARDFRGAIREFETVLDLRSADDGQDFIAEMRRHIDALKRAAP